MWVYAGRDIVSYLLYTCIILAALSPLSTPYQGFPLRTYTVSWFVWTPSSHPDRCSELLRDILSVWELFWVSVTDVLSLWHVFWNSWHLFRNSDRCFKFWLLFLDVLRFWLVLSFWQMFLVSDGCSEFLTDVLSFWQMFWVADNHFELLGIFWYFDRCSVLLTDVLSFCNSCSLFLWQLFWASDTYSEHLTVFLIWHLFLISVTAVLSLVVLIWQVFWLSVGCSELLNTERKANIQPKDSWHGTHLRDMLCYS